MQVPQTIALVDDDRNILTSVSMMLEAEGFAVRTYTDGAEALRGLSSNPVDLAILDIKMPRMDGMELLEKLRRGSDLPVIFLTAKALLMDMAEGQDAGSDLYLIKPVLASKLLSMVGMFLSEDAPLAKKRSQPFPAS